MRLDHLLSKEHLAVLDRPEPPDQANDLRWSLMGGTLTSSASAVEAWVVLPGDRSGTPRSFDAPAVGTLLGPEGTSASETACFTSDRRLTERPAYCRYAVTQTMGPIVP